MELERYPQATTLIFPPSIPVCVYIHMSAVTLIDYRLQNFSLNSYSPALATGLEQKPITLLMHFLAEKKVFPGDHGSWLMVSINNVRISVP